MMYRYALKSAVVAAIGLLVSAGNVCAQSSAQIYGVLDVWAGRSQTSGAGPSTSVVNNGGMQTSYWGIGGSEDLGGSTKVIYAIEGYLQLDTGAAGRSPTDAMFARNAYVGIQGALGEVKVGRILNPLFVATAQTNPFGGSMRLGPLLAQIWSVAMGRAVYGDTSWDNTIMYTTPVMSGFKATAYAALGETSFGNSTNNVGVTANYTRAGLTAIATVQRVRVGPGLAKIGQSEQKTYFAGGSYDFGVLKAYATFDVANGDVPDTRAKTGQAGVSVPVGAGSVMISWAQTRNSGFAMADTHRDTAAVGYDYYLSKRTDLYGAIQYDKLSTANSAQTYAVGIRHRF